MTELLSDTVTFFLRPIAAELQKEIDWRARAFGRNVLTRVLVYLAALARDLIRIPLHHPRGIGQAQFRARVIYIQDTALPTLGFFASRYPLPAAPRARLDAAAAALRQGIALLRDGALPRVDEWYATIDEFGQLTEYSRAAARELEALVADLTAARDALPPAARAAVD